jgi:serine/threonine protein kinase
MTKKSSSMTGYVATRWYRAPELLLSNRDYSPSGKAIISEVSSNFHDLVDMWSCGVILAELLRRKPFLPGTNTESQLKMIFEIIGTPSQDDILNVRNERGRAFLESLPKLPMQDFEKLFPSASALGNINHHNNKKNILDVNEFFNFSERPS